MKLSVSLTESDVETLDRYMQEAGLASRSAAIQRAIRLLAQPGLEAAYAEAFREWDVQESAWEITVADGLDAAR